MSLVFSKYEFNVNLYLFLLSFIREWGIGPQLAHAKLSYPSWAQVNKHMLNSHIHPGYMSSSSTCQILMSFPISSSCFLKHLYNAYILQEFMCPAIEQI